MECGVHVDVCGRTVASPSIGCAVAGSAVVVQRSVEEYASKAQRE